MAEPSSPLGTLSVSIRPSQAEQEARMTEALASKTLVELPFFSSQPDSSTHRRFCDNRKSAFVQRMHRQEEKTKFDEHPPVRWPETIPDPTFHFASCLETDKVLRGPDKALMHPFVPGKGVQPPSLGCGESVGGRAVGSNPGCSEIFPRFDFDISSSAMSSSAYGRHVPFRRRDVAGGHEKCAAFEQKTKSLAQQNAEQKEAVARQKAEFDATVALAQKKLGRNIKKRYGNGSANVRRLLEVFGD